MSKWAWLLLCAVSAQAEGVSDVPESLRAQSREPAAIAPDADRDFTRAVGLMEAGKESEALVSFADFLRRYPTHVKAPEAQYLLAEIHFRRRQYTEALNEFRKVLRYGLGPAHKAPEAALRMGECQAHLHQSEWARIEWSAVQRRYPNTPAAARATELLAGLSP